MSNHDTVCEHGDHIAITAREFAVVSNEEDRMATVGEIRQRLDDGVG